MPVEADEVPTLTFSHEAKEKTVEILSQTEGHFESTWLTRIHGIIASDSYRQQFTIACEGIVDGILEKATELDERITPACARLSGKLFKLLPVAAGKEFRKILLDKCQMEFQEDIRTTARALHPILPPVLLRRRIGLTHFITQLYTVNLLSTTLMVNILSGLLTRDAADPTGESLERLCILLGFAGPLLENPGNFIKDRRSHKVAMNQIFARFKQAGNHILVSQFVKDKILELYELRNSQWNQLKYETFQHKLVTEFSELSQGSVTSTRPAVDEESHDSTVPTSTSITAKICVVSASGTNTAEFSGIGEDLNAIGTASLTTGTDKGTPTAGVTSTAGGTSLADGTSATTLAQPLQPNFNAPHAVLPIKVQDNSHTDKLDLSTTVKEIVNLFKTDNQIDIGSFKAKFDGRMTCKFLTELFRQISTLQWMDEECLVSNLVQYFLTEALITKLNLDRIIRKFISVELREIEETDGIASTFFGGFMAVLRGEENDLAWIENLLGWDTLGDREIVTWRNVLVESVRNEHEMRMLEIMLSKKCNNPPTAVIATTSSLPVFGVGTPSVGDAGASKVLAPAATTSVATTSAQISSTNPKLINNPIPLSQDPIKGSGAPAPQPSKTLGAIQKVQKPIQNDLPKPPKPKLHPFTNPPAPPNWARSLSNATHAMSPYISEPISASSQEYHVIAAMIEPNLKVTQINRIVNPEVWARFTNTRREMLRAKCEDLELLRSLGLTDDEVVRRAHVNGNFRKEPAVARVKYSENMALLFHCTRGKLEDVLSQGLDDRLGSGGTLGRGIYFADDPIKASGYDTNRTLLVFGVLLGDCLSGANGAQLVREPPKSAEQKRNPADLFFDSIVERNPHEFVIFNRNHCCPLYSVTYTTGTSPGVYGGHNQATIPSVYPSALRFIKAPGNQFQGTLSQPHVNYTQQYASSRTTLPPFVWSTQLNRSSRGSAMPGEGEVWPFLARIIFNSMIGDVAASPKSSNSKGLPQSTEDQLEALIELGFTDNVLNRRLLKIFHYDLESTTDSLLEGAAVAIGKSRMSSDTEDEDEESSNECLLCCSEYPHGTKHWKGLCCGHKICRHCYVKLEIAGTTMTGVVHTFLKCPYCMTSSGIEVGTCPTGTMTVTESAKCCSGYEGYSTYVIAYSAPGLSRTAYIPKTKEGTEVVGLLKIAWDRRLCFSMGTSATSGQQNVPVWNIHHKTSQSGGVQTYGYPDPSYFLRVRSELHQYGIN